MGTVVSFDIPAWAAATEEAAAGTTASAAAEHGRIPRAEPPLGEAVRWLHWADRTFSTYTPDSDVSRLGRGEIALADCAPEVTEVLAACATLRAQTGGYFSAYPGGSLDPSGYVKGWAVERAALILSAAGSASHLVNGGGDVQCVGGRSGAAQARGRLPGTGAPPWRVGVTSPLRPGMLAFALAGHDFAVATSGTAERGAHIMDPVRGRPAAGLASITVAGASLTCADAYATAIFAMGPRLGREWAESAMDGYEALAILPDGTTWQTRGFHRYLVSD
jgi:thiamine biosynthesis lipoprotein